MLTIYKASAGSGKTFQLALHYLKMVLGVKDMTTRKWTLNRSLLKDRPSRAHRHVLAITFTNKATDEMKSRIIESLDGVARSQKVSDHPYILPLCAEFGCTFDELRVAARHAMVSILIDFGFFNVSTIDSFFQTVLRTFARELGIQGDYNIEISSNNVVRTALNQLLDDLESSRRANTDRKLADIRRWLDSRALEAKGKFNLFNRNSRDFDDLVNMVGQIYREDFKLLKSELTEYLSHPELLEQFAETVRAEFEKIPERIARIGHAAETDIKASGQEEYLYANTRKFIDKLIAGKVDLSGKPESALKRMLDGTKTIGSHEYCLKKKGVVEGLYEQAVDRMAESLREVYRDYRNFNLLLSVIPQLEFINLSLEYIDRVCEENNMLLLSDTSSYISRIINGSEIPFIYEFLGSHLHHYLIDEFQDTSRMQWDNLLPLVRNSYDSDDDCLIIGDTKQAIYRFRNSDASILGQRLEQHDFPNAEGRKIVGTLPDENRNYRTAHGIVKFNNTILPRFAEIALAEENPAGYTGPEIKQMCAGARADLDARIALFPYGASEKGNAEDDAQKIADIIGEIRRQHDEENFKWSDIAVLYRTTSHVKELLKALLETDIPVQSADSLYLRNASSVRMLVTALTMLAKAGLPPSGRVQEPVATDTAPGAQPARSAGMDPVVFETRYNFFVMHGGSNGESLAPQEALEKALDLSIEASHNVVGRDDGDVFVPRSLEDTINTILRKHPATLVALIEAILSAGLIPDRVLQTEKDYIAAFTDLALGYSENYDNDLNGFLEWWEVQQKKASISAAPDYDAVRVLTIHSAKGLEFGCVHLVDFDWKLVDERENAWLDIRPGDAEHPLNSFGIDFGDLIPRHLYPPIICFDVKEATLGYPGSPFRAYLDSQKRLMRLDALNIAYVGLTRAKSRLNIYFNSKYPTKNGEVNFEDYHVGNVLTDLLPEVVGREVSPGDEYSLFIPPDSYDAETFALRLEVPATKPNAKESRSDESEKVADIAATFSHPYTSFFRADMESIVNVAALERNAGIEGEDSPDEEEFTGDTPEMLIERRKYHKSEHTQRGLDLHEILSHIKAVDSDADMDDVFETAYARAEKSVGFVSAAREDYRSVIAGMVARPEARRWFDAANRIDTELPYHKASSSGAGGADFEPGRMYRIDRLVELADGSVEIVDYKFSSETSGSYVRQVHDYVSDIASVFPGRRVRGYLWYVDLDKIEEV